MSRPSNKAGILPDRETVFFICVILIAVVLRFASLSLKPPHADEGVNGHFVNQIWQHGFFRYNPENYHGPLLFYLFQVSEKLFGFGVHSFRIVTALFSFLTLFIFLRSGALGRTAVMFVVAALAVSPAMVFFGRSAIHEPVYLFFQVLLVLGFIGLWERPGREGLVWCAAGLTGSALLKETFLILCAATALAFLWTMVWPRILKDMKHSDSIPPRLRLPTGESGFILKVIAISFLVWLAFFTGFFHYAKGAGDFFRALLPWIKTGITGSGHEKPFFYWLFLMSRYEWAGLAGAGLALWGVFSRGWKLRFFSCLAIANWLVYSAIHYKTPWCILGILWPFLVVGGLVFERIIAQRNSRLTRASLCVLAVILAHDLMSSYRLNFIHYSDESEPYVYVQTTNEYKIIEEIFEKKLRVSPAARNMKIQMNLAEAWPLPWFLSRYHNVVFGHESDPPDPDADVIFTELSRDGAVLAKSHLRRKIDLRNAREPFYFYLKKTTFDGISIPGFGPVAVAD